MKKVDKKTEEADKILQTIKKFVSDLDMGIFTSHGSIDYLIDIVDTLELKEGLLWVSACFDEIINCFKWIIRDANTLKERKYFYIEWIEELSNSEAKDEEETKNQIKNCKKQVLEKDEQIYNLLTEFFNNPNCENRIRLAEKYKSLLSLKFNNAFVIGVLNELAQSLKEKVYNAFIFDIELEANSLVDKIV